MDISKHTVMVPVEDYYELINTAQEKPLFTSLLHLITSCEGVIYLTGSKDFWQVCIGLEAWTLNDCRKKGYLFEDSSPELAYQYAYAQILKDKDFFTKLKQ